MMETAGTVRRASLAGRLFAFGTQMAAKHDALLIVLFIGGAFGAMFTVQPVLGALNQFIVRPYLGDWGGLIADIVAASLVVGFLIGSPVFLVWLERKVSGRMQSRPGPLHTGAWHGWLQTLADGIKLILKEDVVPSGADRVLHTISPILVVTVAAVSFAVIPFGSKLIAGDFNIGLAYILATTSLGIFGIVMAGWASNNKYSLLGGMRSAAQLVSYEIPRAVSIVGVIMLAQSLQMSEIVNVQSGVTLNEHGDITPTFGVPFVMLQPIAFVLFLVASIAETNRVPFDLPEAESELVAGFHTEYSGMKFAFFFLAEYGNMMLFACLATALFLGGGSIPFVDGYLQAFTSHTFTGNLAFLQGFWHLPAFLTKALVLCFFFIWVRWTYPRLRVDRLMDFSWKILLPWSFANLIFLGFALTFEKQGGMVIFVVVNWLIVLYVLFQAKPKKV